MILQYTYDHEPLLSPQEFIDVLKRSTLAARRPVEEFERIQTMLANADLILTARDNQGALVGVARTITDFSYCAYLSDLAVDATHQRQGIGRRLIEETRQRIGKQTTLILLAAPAARAYYPHIGMEPHDSCWIWRGDSDTSQANASLPPQS